MNLTTLKAPLVVLLAIFLVNSSYAEQRPILFKQGTVLMTPGIDHFINEEVPYSRTHRGNFYRIVQFDHVLLSREKEELKTQGFEVLEYIPHHAYVTAIAVSADREVLNSYGVVGVREIGAGIKIHEQLFRDKDQIPAHVVDGGRLKVIIQLQKQVDAADVVGDLESRGVRINSLGPSPRIIRASVAADQVQYLTPVTYISYVEPIAEPGVPEALDGKSLHRSTKINTEYNGGVDYDGTGVSFVINDDGFVGPHIDFTGRTDQTDVAGDFAGDHGDMTTGIAGGAGNLDPTVPGMAPGAFIWVRQYNASLPDVLNLHQNEGVMAFSSSYSNGCNAGYTSTTQQVDDQTFDNPGILQSFSAGNSNNNDCGYGAGNQWGNITGGHKIAKNAIAAANLRFNEVLETSSSRGPASDGRIKPDIAAHGTNQLSTDPNNTYAPGGGTSAACPGITGVFAQLVEAFRDKNGGVDPESGLIKACMLNTAHDLGNVGPDFKFGWGRVNAAGAYNIIDQVQYVDGMIEQGVTATESITVPAGTEEVRVMLYWMDPAASTLSFKALVNDIDMSVVDPGGATYQPWILDPTANAASLDAPATNGVDTLNNVEQILIKDPVAGTYDVTLTGTEIPMGPQKYYVVWEFFGGVDLSYPIGGEGLNPLENVRILWEAVADTGSFQLDYTIDGGGSWNPIATVPGDQRFYENWSVPSVISGDVRVRITRGADTDMSDADLSIMQVAENLDLVRMCPTEVRLAWDSVPGATSYTVHKLGAMYMDSIATASTHVIDLPVVDVFEEFWWSVTAHGPNGARNRRAVAVFYDGSGLLNCSVNDELSATELLNPTGTFLSCFGVDSIVSVRIDNNGLVDQGNFSVGYAVNGGTPVIETFSGTISAGTSGVYNFSQPLILNGSLSYDVVAWSSLVGDALPGNDTTSGEFTLVTAMNTPDYNEDFESFNSCSTVDNCEATTCELGSTWFNATSGVDDDIDWRVDAGGTFSQNTGPNVDHNPGSNLGNYIYLEASNGCNGNAAHLISPCVDLAGMVNPELEIWYHMFGGDMGDLHVDLFDGTTWINDIEAPIQGNQGNVWRAWNVDLTAYANTVVALRIRGVTGTGFTSDLALDDISVREAGPNSISENTLEQEIALFPNPNNGQMTLSLSARLEGDVTVAVYDVSGALVFDRSLRSPQGNIDLLMSELSAGIYTLRLQAPAGGQTKRFVIQK